MKISDIKISEFELESNTQHFKLRKVGSSWEKYAFESPVGKIHVLHVMTDAGLEGICTVGDARYTTMSEEALSYLKYLVILVNLIFQYYYLKLHPQHYRKDQ